MFHRYRIARDAIAAGALVNAKSPQERYENLFLSISIDPKHHPHDTGEDPACPLQPTLCMEQSWTSYMFGCYGISRGAQSGGDETLVEHTGVIE